jgi:hypothetical protein
MFSSRALISGQPVGVLCNDFGVTGGRVFVETLAPTAERLLDEDEPACHAEIISEWADRINCKQDTGSDQR